ncbi:T9SS type A sorting domain-containing protein [Faecalibacter rhinopitheci]|uniref:T9SS type A sorting domain-containing protein n=1 Tax=Faecalibacter rhinopitheci TaxID=2779678 RepID=A0A8J7FSW5_9FLAO|nr:T9SS type A sorting domain-containing protein [Faecalibacter rhinopitheci]MBF0598318.1 T9SS type A sorting domain-containing protein [Faecalibacter rhinopitheci]
MKFNPNGQLVWGSFYGSSGREQMSNLLPIDDETFYLAGLTDSPKDITTPNSHQPNYSYLPDNGDYGQLFLAKFGRNDDLSTSDISTSTLKIYPNPTKDKVYIKGFIHQDSLIEVYNLVGQKVITQKAKSGLTQTIDVQFLPKGTYIIKATDINGKAFQDKLLIN